MKDIRQTPAYAKYLQEIGWQVEKLAGNYIFVKNFPVLGKFIKIQRPEKLTAKLIKQLTEIKDAFQIVIEPNLPFFSFSHKQLLTQGFKLSKSPYLPSKTLEIDLTKPIPIIQATFKKDARAALRKNEKVKITAVRDLTNFRKSWKKAVPLSRYVLPLTHLQALKNSFRQKCVLFQDEQQNAGAIFLIADKKAYYWQAFTNPTGRSQKIQYKIVWEGILWAKKLGAHFFDFEGIYDERFPNPKWKGFTHFKKSFSRNEKEYPGCFAKTNWKNLLKNILGTTCSGNFFLGMLPEQNG